MMKMKRARIIYNPTSGKEAFRKQLPDVLQKLEQAGYETSCHATTCAGDAKKAAKTAGERGTYDIIIAAGGDGTVNEVVTGLMKVDNPPILGVIPVGTTNDFGRAMHIGRDILSAVDIIIDGHHIPVDIGRANDKYFINIAAMGNLTEISYEAPSKLKTVLGEFAYVIKGVEKLPFIHPTFVEIEYDGKKFEDEIMLFLLSNTNSVGGFEKLAPEASVNDGMFDMLIVRKGNIPEMVNLLRRTAKGTHIDHPLVYHERVSRAKVTAREKLQLNLDGEYGGDVPVEFENLYQHLRVFVPRGYNG
jgi:diacylglycerol kinase (ATP)